MNCFSILFFLISLGMTYYYTLFITSSAGRGPNFLNEKVCAANQMTFHPLVYETEEELQHFLSFPGSENVTEKFYNIMVVGLVINVMYVAHVLY